MSKVRNENRFKVAQGVAEKLIALEDGIDTALELASALNGHLPAARKSACLAAEVGQNAIEHACIAHHHLVLARAAIIKSHQDLAGVQQEIGLGAFAFGGAYGKPTSAELHIVDTQAA